MQTVDILCLLVASLWLTEGFVLNTNRPMVQRNVTKTLSVDNGRRWGTWRDPEFCGLGTYAVGYNMKIEPYRITGDDSELNGIELRCESMTGDKYDSDITSAVGDYGDWYHRVTSCNSQGVPHFLTSFAMQTEDDQGPNVDDTAVNYVKFHCRDLKNATDTEFELVQPPGHGDFGIFGEWSESCDENTAICGLQTRLEGPQGQGDDTALNDVKMFCCT